MPIPSVFCKWCCSRLLSQFNCKQQYWVDGWEVAQPVWMSGIPPTKQSTPPASPKGVSEVFREPPFPWNCLSRGKSRTLPKPTQSQQIGVLNCPRLAADPHPALPDVATCARYWRKRPNRLRMLSKQLAAVRGSTEEMCPPPLLALCREEWTFVSLLPYPKSPNLVARLSRYDWIGSDGGF